MKKKLSLSNLSGNAICKKDQGQIAGGEARAECWNTWVAQGKPGDASYEQSLNHKFAPVGSAEYMKYVWPTIW